MIIDKVEFKFNILLFDSYLLFLFFVLCFSLLGGLIQYFFINLFHLLSWLRIYNHFVILVFVLWLMVWILLFLLE